jgi:hypothetical protein
MPFPICTDRHYCYNKEVVSVGTHLNICYMHDSFIPFFFILTDNMWYTSLTDARCYVYVVFLVIKPLGIKKRNSNSENKSTAATMTY